MRADTREGPRGIELSSGERAARAPAFHVQAPSLLEALTGTEARPRSCRSASAVETCDHEKKGGPRGNQRFPRGRVRWRGLEPPRGCPHKALNLARLPIPPP